MPAPYEQGQPLAWIEIDAEGLRVHRAAVDTVHASASADRWIVTTDRGTTTVDASGVGSAAVPREPDIDADLYIFGDGYLVTSTLIGMELSADADRSLDEGDDLDLGC